MRSVVSVGVLTAASRILGLLRESTKAHFLGTTYVADAFHIAFMVPSAFRQLVAEGAVSSAIVPVFTRYAKSGSSGAERAEMRLVAEKYLTFWLGLVLAVTVAGVVLSGRALFLLGELGFVEGAAKVELTAELIRVIFWYLLLVGLAAALQGILHAHSSFALPALSPVLFNAGFIALVWCTAPWLPEDARVYAFAWAVLAGGALQFLLLVPPVWRLGVRPRLRWPFDHPGVRAMVRLLVPATFGAGIYQINVVVNLFLASRLEGDGLVAALGYSSRLMEVVLGVFVFALNTVSLTSLSRHAAAGDDEAYSSNLEEVLRLVLFVTVPSAVGLFLLREPVIRILFQSGSFDEESVRLTAGAFQFHVAGLCFVGLSRALVSGFYALREVRTPVRVAAINLFVNVALAWSLSRGSLGYAGIALASTLSAAFQVVLLAVALRGRVRGALLGRVAAACAQALGAAAVMGAMLVAVRGLLAPAWGKGFLAAALLAVILGGAAVYFAAARLLGVPEAARLLEGIARRRGQGR